MNDRTVGGVLLPRGDRMKLYRVAAGIVRRGDRLLLVEQVTGLGRYWSLPGGVAEEGESARGALERELIEEAAVRADEVTLRYVTEVHASESLTVACVFDVPRWSPAGPSGGDPAGEIVSCEFVFPDEVAGRLSTIGRPAMVDPVMEHLAGAGSTYYVYRGEAERQTRTSPGRPVGPGGDR